MTRGNVVILLVLALAPWRASGQTSDTSLLADIAAVQAAIRSAEEEDQKFSGGLVKSLISLRLATLRQTLALLDQRARASAARTTLQYTIDGKQFALPSDAPEQIAAVEKELADISAKVAKQEAEVARYSGGLVQATAMATLATLRQSQAMLEQKRLALKYGLPQFVGFKDLLPSGGSPAAPESHAAATSASVGGASSLQAKPPQLPSDCMKVVFGSFCLGAPISTLPANPAPKSDDMWIYAEPQPTAVTVVESRIAVVGRFYTPGTWLTYRNLEGDLIEKYGKGKDLSFFPSYADDSSSRETAISLKKGRAIHSWQQQGFTVQLRWDNSEHVALLYFHDKLEAKRAAKKKDQY
jgi:hypothetical protein